LPYQTIAIRLFRRTFTDEWRRHKRRAVEQIGQSWGKHAFAAASSNSCNFGCNGVGGDHLGSGCSDAYGASLNGSQGGIGSRAWVNPFTGSFPVQERTITAATLIT